MNNHTDCSCQHCCVMRQLHHMQTQLNAITIALATVAAGVQELTNALHKPVKITAEPGPPVDR